MYVCSQIVAAANGCSDLTAIWCVQPKIYFPAHYVDVTNMSLHYNLFSVVKIYHRRMASRGASQKDDRLVCIPVAYEAVVL